MLFKQWTGCCCCADVAGPDCQPALPAVADIVTNSVDSDGDCRTDETGCYTPGVLSVSADLKYYGDRDYVMTEIPPFLTGMNFVRTANDDKRADASDLEFLCFNVDDDATVYLLYDSRATSLPAWTPRAGVVLYHRQQSHDRNLI